MIKNKAIWLVLAAITGSCSQERDADGDNSQQSRLDELQSSVDSLRDVTDKQSRTIAVLRDSVSVLKFPATDRLAKAKRLISEDNLTAAEAELNNLVSIFPDAEESAAVPELRDKIAAEKEKQRLEAERIAALGFKALDKKTTVTVGYNTIKLSSFSTGTKFTFDAYDDSWYYRTADRDSKFVTMAMSVQSTSKSPMLPQFAVYTINGSMMELAGTFDTRYARWSDFGAYLGNYSDTRNDFAKVSTVSFKLGAEVSDAVVAGPYAIVMTNANVMSEQYDRFRNPPQFWVNTAEFPKNLTVDSFRNNFVLIKTFNL